MILHSRWRLSRNQVQQHASCSGDASYAHYRAMCLTISMTTRVPTVPMVLTLGSGVSVSLSRISLIAAKVKKNGGNGKMVGKWGEMRGNGGKWRKMEETWGGMGGTGTASMNAIYTGPYDIFLTMVLGPCH